MDSTQYTRRRGHEDEEDDSAAPPIKPNRSHWIGPSTLIQSSTADTTSATSPSSRTCPSPIPTGSNKTKGRRKKREAKDVVYRHWLSKVKSYGGCLEDAPAYLRSDKKIVMTAVQNDLYGCSCALEYASPELKADKQVVITALEHTSEALQHASPELRNDKSVVLIAVSKFFDAFRYAAPNLRIDNDVIHRYWLSKVKQFGGGRLEEAPESIRRDKTIVTTAFKLMEESLQYASTELRQDKHFMLHVAQSNPDLLRYITPELRLDMDIKSIINRYWLSRVTEEGGNEIRHAPEYIRNDKQIVIAAVQQDGWALQHASPGLQNDTLVVATAVQKEGRALKFASPELRNDRQIVLDAVENNPLALYLSPPKHRNDKKVVMAAVQRDGSALFYVTHQSCWHKVYLILPELREDRELNVAAVQNNGLLLADAPPELQNDRKLVIAAVQQNGLALCFASPEVQNDKQVVLAAVNQNPNAIKYAPDTLKRDADILVAAGMYDEEHDDAVTRQKTQMNTTSKKRQKSEFLSRLSRKPNRNTKDVNTPIKKKMALSTRFSLDPSSESEATKFTKLLKSHKYIEQNFVVYAPNAFDKKTCDPHWTNFNHPCRGTKDTCQYYNILTKDGYPTDDCCWRYSYRNQLEEAKSTGGFMLQLVEKDSVLMLTEDGSPVTLSLGKGQEIELDMATQLKLKT